MTNVYDQMLDDLAQRGRRRALAPRVGADFSSNDYLALAESPELSRAATDAIARGVPVGAGGSRLLRGNHPEHEALEAEAAEHFGAQSALFFGGGFVANFALFSALPQSGDFVVYDDLIHASVHEGLRSGRAQRVPAKHNDVTAFDDAICAWRAKGGTGRPWIAVESLYSMDGDRAPIDDLAAVARRHDAMLVVDEAHATGVYGARGGGLASRLESRDSVISLHTCGKALGVMGALLCGPKPMRDFLINRSRSFIYATAPSPLIAAVTRAALTLAADADDRRRRLADLVAFAGREIEQRCGVPASGSQIQPVVVGSDARAVALATRLQALGYDIRAIRPPTVPEGTSRLRIALTLNADEALVARMVGDLARELKNL